MGKCYTIIIYTIQNLIKTEIAYQAANLLQEYFFLLVCISPDSIEKFSANI